MYHRDAIKAYQEAEQDFLVEGADAHNLVRILYEELLSSLDRARDGLARSDLGAKSAHLSKALTIIHVLATSLDFDRGGEVAQSLAQLYEWARRKVIDASRNNLMPAIEDVHKAISEIANAWNSIAGARAA